MKQSSSQSCYRLCLFFLKYYMMCVCMYEWHMCASIYSWTSPPPPHRLHHLFPLSPFGKLHIFVSCVILFSLFFGASSLNFENYQLCCLQSHPGLPIYLHLFTWFFLSPLLHLYVARSSDLSTSVYCLCMYVLTTPAPSVSYHPSTNLSVLYVYHPVLPHIPHPMPSIIIVYIHNDDHHHLPISSSSWQKREAGERKDTVSSPVTLLNTLTNTPAPTIPAFSLLFDPEPFYLFILYICIGYVTVFL